MRKYGLRIKMKGEVDVTKPQFEKPGYLLTHGKVWVTEEMLLTNDARILLQKYVSDSLKRIIKEEESDSEKPVHSHGGKCVDGESTEMQQDYSEAIKTIKRKGTSDNQVDIRGKALKRCRKRSAINDQAVLDSAGVSYICDICHKAFSRIDEVEKHILAHKGENPYYPDDCISQGGGLANLNGIHTKERRFKCKICGKAYIFQHHLANHISSHSTHALFECQKCNKRFKNKSLLMKHEQESACEMHFKCDLCDKAFNQNNQLTHHMLSVHRIKKRYTCDQCGKSSNQRNCLDRHNRIFHQAEGRFICKICGKGFLLKNNLTRHISEHSRERVYKCVVCDSTFKRQENLDADNQTGSGENFHKCQLCESMYI